MWKLILICTATIVLPSITNADEAYFSGVGFLPGGRNSFAYAVSGDGRVVVGTSNSSRAAYQEAFRWTRAGGIEAIPDIDGREVEIQSLAYDANYDGSIIAGEVLRADDHVKAFRFTNETGMVDLGDLPGGSSYSSARSISGDGLVVGGESISTRSHPDVEPFIWNETNGMQPLDEWDGPEGARVLHIWSLSHDGNRGVAAAGAPLLWETGTGWTELPRFENAFYAQANAISADGLSIVGECGRTIDGRNIQRPWRWSEKDGVQELGQTKFGYYGSKAEAVSGDGTVIAGTGAVGDFKSSFIWDVENGLRGIQAVLDEYGIDTSNWNLNYVRGISDDGRTIVGIGHERGNGGSQGWVAHIPRCNRFKYPLGDSDGSGSVDFNDIDCFVAALISKDAWVSCGPARRAIITTVSMTRTMMAALISGILIRSFPA